MNALRKALLLGGMGLCGTLATSEPARAADQAATATGTDSKTTVRKHKRQIHAAETVASDNTGTNKRDRDSKEVTADQQKNQKSDVQLAAEIRRSIVQDKTLSLNAHNIKIIVQQGNVTLKGPVASTAEKTAVERKAAEVLNASGGKIANEMNIAP